jgi:hypothetical protein
LLRERRKLTDSSPLPYWWLAWQEHHRP